jgi:HEPN domain-containing protein
MSEKQKQLAQEWFEAALSDYQYAAIGLKEDYIFPQVVFLSQQVGEKFLKGFLILNTIEPSRTHDLTKLLDSCVKIRPELESLRDACEALTGFYIEVRYPPDIPQYSKTEIQEAFDHATLVKETIMANAAK